MVLPRTEFQVDSFALIALKTLSPCLLTYMASNEKSGVNLIEDPLYMMNCFSLAAFRVFFLSSCSDNLIIVCLGVCLLYTSDAADEDISV